MHSSLYVGRVRHQRFTPRLHGFVYEMPFFYLDLAEIQKIFRRRFLLATRGFSVLAFRRRDYLGEETQDLDSSVRDAVEQKLGKRPAGPIRILTQISYFGFCFNPISLYYCFSAADDRVEFVVAQVTNTPWHQRHIYVVEAEPDSPMHFEVPKDFHVSPFMPMRMMYHWRLGPPGKMLTVHMENRALGQSEPVFEASMALRKLDLDARSLGQILLRFPFLTARAYLAIYWQALLLFLKRVQYYAYPSTGDV